MELSELAVMADSYIIARDSRLAADKQADQLKKVEVKLKEALLDEMIHCGVSTVGGQLKRVTRRPKTRAVAGNWAEIYEFISENAAFDLLQRRLSDPAVSQRVEDGVTVPGVEFVEINDLSVSKL
jgi:hypothetical protein